MSRHIDSPSVNAAGVTFPDVPVSETLQKGKHTAALIWLHGLGDEPSGVFTQRFLQELTGPKFEHIKVFTPAAPIQPVTCNKGHRMPSWFDIQELPFRENSKTSSYEDMQGAVQFVHGILDKCISAGIPSSRIVLIGISQGGATTLVSTLTYREKLAAGMVLWGWMPIPVESLKAKLSPEGQKTPIAWSHGMNDFVISYDCAVKGQKMLQEMGVTCGLSSYKNGGHFVNDQEMATEALYVLRKLPAIEDLVGEGN